MEGTYTVDGVCPVCGYGMVISRLSCRNCGSALEGSFSLDEYTTEFEGHFQNRGKRTDRDTRNDRGMRTDRGEARFGLLARLDTTQLEFVEVFLRCRGIIKNVEDMLGISYPTVKARLTNVLETMGVDAEEDAPATDRRRIRREILADLAAGRISTDEVLQILAEDSTADRDKSGGSSTE
ncbi:MAG: DUF2089 domain-containing protein [Chloroflexi bacterium]|nr:MAG: DUF2089 domain-containing protein [Chloroflexota bacterium]